MRGQKPQQQRKSKKKTAAQSTTAHAEANTKKADEEPFERHMLPDEMTDHVAAQVKEIEDYTVRPKSDRDVEPSIDEVIEAQNDAVSPKCDIDAEEWMENKIQVYAVRPKCDMDAESSDLEEKIEQGKVNETAAANDEISKKDAEIKKLV